MKRILILLLLSSKVFAQEEAKDVIYKGFYNLSFLVKSPVGRFKDAISSDFSKLNSSGLSISYLTNPRIKVGELSTLLIGGEVGFVGNRQNKFFQPATSGDFFMNHRQAWANLRFRYLPNLAIKKVIPYLDGGLGPKFYFSRMMENVGEDEIYKVYGFTSTTLSYNLEAGASYKISGEKRPFSYLEFGLGYSQANSLKIIDRERVGFLSNFDVIDPKKSVRPQDFYLKIGITSYL
ncbi:hypothetical protein [Lacihabitans soyangensis]|uniref:Outer membrane protein beta-barrel domain-containing protein n=1 Tax=Lacihabitans soyangensis TaxID=869394 RepID=A0AAE3KUW2_9BACT|nr:hypothetical protein [Lacihabitans soyangensis]MCP9765369.1 hypothetical protein [Lacihabitans soyangensis]